MRLLNGLATGWGVSAIGIYQSGYPLTVFTDAPFTAGGDYNADGDNYDFPDVTSYDMRRSLEDYLTNGVFTRDSSPRQPLEPREPEARAVPAAELRPDRPGVLQEHASWTD